MAGLGQQVEAAAVGEVHVQDQQLEVLRRQSLSGLGQGGAAGELDVFQGEADALAQGEVILCSGPG